MDRSLNELVVTLAGRKLVGVWDRLCRYCGLEWSGGDPETWAFAYYDSIDFGTPNAVMPTDVMAAAALHPGISRSDLAFFVDEAASLSAWLEVIPQGVPLHQLAPDIVSHIGTLGEWDGAVNLSLLSKVLHRKRPDAIPLLDRHIVDWYRPVTGERAAAKAYPRIVNALRDDLLDGAALPLALMKLQLQHETGRAVSLLRVADIAIWTEAWK